MLATTANVPACRTHQPATGWVPRLRSWSRMAAQSQWRASRPRRPHAGSSALEGEPTRLPTAQPRPGAAKVKWSTVPTTSCSASWRSGAAPFRIAFKRNQNETKSPTRQATSPTEPKWSVGHTKALLTLCKVQTRTKWTNWRTCPSTLRPRGGPSGPQGGPSGPQGGGGGPAACTLP